MAAVEGNKVRGTLVGRSAGTTSLPVSSVLVDKTNDDEKLPTKLFVKCKNLSGQGGEIGRRVFLPTRWRRAYFLYCLVCLLLSLASFVSTLRKLIVSTSSGRPFNEWLAWETDVELVIGIAVFLETLSAAWLVGCHAFLHSRWCIVDVLVVSLTVITWVLLVLQQSLETMMEVELPLHCLRFVLQPCRVLAATTNLQRVKELPQSSADIAFDKLRDDCEEESSLVQGSKILTRKLQTQIAARLPVWCRFRDWELLYSPDEHGISIRTFFRSQEGAGANVILIRDSQGSIFGGFVTQEWMISSKPCWESQESFVLTTCAAAAAGSPSVDVDDGAFFYHVTTGHRVLLSSDSRTISLSGAIHLRDDFRAGSTMSCPAFASPCLTTPVVGSSSSAAMEGNSVEFIVRHFECWQLKPEGE
eukprot:TRINITY_DN31387_c0_g1_i1.p1 TRINITY_DN31387_c0_g1~~TRINITY_DN31387_c0_g1_i1.p1  ORF type:complete len:466 (+),score=74.38 TRINITY_DN31387_c0_g1_i1:152-1399(+)